MSDDNLQSEIRKLLQNNSENQIKAKEKNEEIKNRIIKQFEKAIEYLHALKKGEHIEKKAIEINPDLLSQNKPHINTCIQIAENLKQIIVNYDVENDDLSYLDTFQVALSNIINEYSEENYFLLPKYIGNTRGSLVGIESFIRTFNLDKQRYNLVVSNEIKSMLKEAKQELEDFKETKNIIKNLKSVDYYSEECEKYMSRHYTYLVLFLITILVALTISVISVCSEPKFFLDKFDYWFLKGSFILVAITLVSYFIKQSSHYQSLADQANQTRLELQAFPTFITGVEKADEVAIRKELAFKYFGREIDKTTHKDMSNLVSDQIKNTTEMVKAVTEVIKKPGNS
ncbi:hypothetical protein [Acinetobacter nosocomialis]|uniref:hypothetical protein n=1 Tax=Acinetobacter nosocomialis TaxID=106654 RepID=UPI001250456A|nr:hypothetical protein [Acinetobacter nosocomialis]MBP1483703.1 hypothetical protein [Acinetobacter nosocomialis]